MNDRGIFPSKRRAGIALAFFCILLAGINVRYVGASHQVALIASAGDERAGNISATAEVGHHTTNRTQGPGHSSIVVKVSPRLDQGKGDASIQVFDKQGTLIQVLSGIVQFQGLTVGIKGPRRDIKDGDTPFGVYKYAKSLGGDESGRLGVGFGTGRVFLDDYDMYGEVADVHRRLIRFHGGGTGLPDPYKLDQKLLKTRGCVRMKNRDVNTLIQTIKRRPQDDSLKYIFMGDDKYLKRLATNPALSDKPWQRVLQIDLRLDQPAPPAPVHIPVVWRYSSTPDEQQPVARLERISPEGKPEPIPTEINQEASSEQAPTTQQAQLLERVELFSEDVGENGVQALAQMNSLYPDKANLVQALSNLRESLPADDGRRPQIAFVLCHLGEDCATKNATNRKIIESALDGTTRYNGFFADQAEEMISRLIDKGEDRELLQLLFNAAPESDGGLSEGLSVSFTEKLRDHTIFFLTVLKDQSKIIISKVAELIRDAAYLTRQEIKKLKARINRAENSSHELKETLNKLLASLVQGRHKGADDQQHSSP